jgi:redox-sensing transcriptional repressor
MSELPAKLTVRPEIPKKAIYRLSVYFRSLQRLKENGIPTVSSEALAVAAGVKPTQLRKDLAYFGQFGTRGLGYEVDQLLSLISDLLGTTRLQPVILVGVGNLGTALLSYTGFNAEGFDIVGAFDVTVTKSRQARIPVRLYSMEALPEIIQRHDVQVALLTVPAHNAQEVANILIENGIKGILNFAPVVISCPDDVQVNNVNLAMELQNLSYFIKQ